jgi:MYXO-CTERM domain-containing protein
MPKEAGPSRLGDKTALAMAAVAAALFHRRRRKAIYKIKF